MDEIIKRAERYHDSHKDSQFAEGFKDVAGITKELERAMANLADAYAKLDLETCLNPAAGTDQSRTAASVEAARVKDSSRLLTDVLIEHRRAVLEMASQRKIVFNEAQKAEMNNGLALSLAWAESGVALAEQARVALAAYRRGSVTDPAIATNTLKAAESFESTLNALASRRNEIRTKLEQALSR